MVFHGAPLKLQLQGTYRGNESYYSERMDMCISRAIQGWQTRNGTATTVARSAYCHGLGIKKQPENIMNPQGLSLLLPHEDSTHCLSVPLEVLA